MYVVLTEYIHDVYGIATRSMDTTGILLPGALLKVNLLIFGSCLGQKIDWKSMVFGRNFVGKRKQSTEKKIQFRKMENYRQFRRE